MLRTIDYTALDDDTKAYLREVRNRHGAGAPGVFHAVGDAKPVIALLIGLVVLPLFVWAGYTTNKPAWANAMLQTAGVLLGGWLVLYAIRRWTANPDRYVGKFFYFDPENVYLGDGDQLSYAPVDDETEAAPVGASAVRIATADGRFDAALPNRAVAVAVANFYDALGHLRADEGGRWDKLNPAEYGAVARYMVRHDHEPQDLNEVDLDIDAVPEEVHPKRGGGLGFVRYLVILAVGAGVFYGFATTNAPIQDEANFAELKGGGPATLRLYLLNPNNTKHREEAEELLRRQYDAPIQAVRDKATDGELKEAFVKLLETLRGPDTPAVSIGVADTDKAALSSWADGLRVRLADGIGTAVGKDHIVFVRKPDDKPPLIDVTYTNADNGRLTWTVELRKSPDDPQPYFKATRSNTLTVDNPTGPRLTPSEALYQDLMTRMVGTAPAAPPPLPPDDDW